jgi:PmbA protein
MDILKELSSAAEQVEVISLQNETTNIEFKANQLKASKVSETAGTGVRVVRNGKLGFSAAAGGGSASMKKLAAYSLESAAYGDPVAMKFPTLQPAQPVVTYDQAIVDLPIPRLVEIGREILDLILPIEPDAQVNVTLERSVQSLSIRNHTGLEIAFKRSPLSISLEIDRIIGDDVLILFDQSGTSVWEKDYLAFAHHLVEKLVLARKLTSLRSGNMPVLFSPTGALALGLPLMEGLNGKNVYKGISPMVGKVGEKLFDAHITLVDDGTMDGKFGSAPYDDEGIPHRRTTLVDQGVLKGFMYDLKTAAQSGVESTGNASRGLFSPPEPAPTNLVIQPGKTPLADIISGIDEGLLVEDLLGLGQGNIISGAFSNPLALAFKIEKGEIVGRVKNVSIAGNVYDLLKNVAAVSQETRWVYNALRLPYILLPDMNVVAKE